MKTFNILVGILAILISLAMIGCESEPQSAEWYSGGTLHKATIAEWHQATYANRLATCADWVKALEEPETEIDYSTVKPKAIELEKCITDATVDIPVIRKNHDVSKYAATCIVLLDLKRKATQSP